MKRNKYRYLPAAVIIIVLGLVLCLAGCQGVEINQNANGPDSPGAAPPEHGGATSQEPPLPPDLPLNIQPVAAPQLSLQSYDSGYFSVDLPQGWTLETVGEFQNFGFRAYDPAVPARQIIFYGNMRYFLKSQAAKESWISYVQGFGYADAQVYADAPVLAPATTEQFFYTFNDYAAYAARYGIAHNFPYFSDIQVLESGPRNSPIAYACVDDSIIRMVFNQEGQVCEGLFGAGVADATTYYMYDVDAGYYVVYYITGISAPAEEFHQLCDILAQSLGSFRFADGYIQQGVSLTQWGTEAALEVGRALSQAAEASAQSWHDRQRPLDSVGQKQSDSTLGYERLYDADTGEVYRAELGFYDEYDINRNDYGNSDLHKLSDNDYQLYDQAISGYIYK